MSTRKTIVQSVSFQLDVLEWLQQKSNVSQVVNEALKEYIKNRQSSEQKIKRLKEEAGKINKRLAEIKQEIDDIFEMEMKHENPEEHNIR